MSNLFKVNSREVVNGAVNAVIAAVVVGLYGIVLKDGFDLFSVDWTMLLHSMVNWAFAGFIGSIGKSFLTSSDGTILGMVRVK